MAKRFDQLSPASKATVLDLFCKANDYVATITSYDTTDPANPVMKQSANPETKAQFAQRLCQEWVVRQALVQRAQDQAAAAQSDADLV